MEIIYLDINGISLGKASYSDFNEILIPYFTQNYNNYLTILFNGHSNFYWKIINCAINLNEVTITIEPNQNNPKSINRVAKDNSSTPKRFLTEFTLVEVEFGFYSNVLKKDGEIQKNYNYSSALLNGEIHKRRPCIVLKLFDQTAQVIPLTSKVDKVNTNIDIQIDMNNISGISSHYHKPTYALIEMIQTVSYDRVFPPRGVDGKFHHKSYYLPAKERNNIKTGLASLYNSGIESKVSSLIDNVEKLNQEKFRILDNNKKILADKEMLEKNILKIGKFLNIGDDIDTITKELGKI